MSHAIIHEPDFDLDAFRDSLTKWSAEGAKSVVIEWQTGPGPTVSWYPAGARTLAQTWRYKVPVSQYNEQYADYLDHTLTPRLAETARSVGVKASIVCVDQQPIVIQRQRRRELGRAAKASGAPAAH